MPDDDDTPGRDTGLAFRMALIDYNDRDADGQPSVIQVNQEFTNLDLARMDSREFQRVAVEMASRKILSDYRDRTGESDDGDDGGSTPR